MRLKGRMAGHSVPFGPESSLNPGTEKTAGNDAFHGVKSAVGVVKGAGGWGRHQSTIRGEEMDIELVEWDLRQVFEVHLTCPVSGSGLAEPTSLEWIP